MPSGAIETIYRVLSWGLLVLYCSLFFFYESASGLAGLIPDSGQSAETHRVGLLWRAFQAASVLQVAYFLSPDFQGASFTRKLGFLAPFLILFALHLAI
jgi:hypothetical protein